MRERSDPSERRRSRHGWAACLLLMIPVATPAATTSGSFTVSATVLAACTVTANNLAFGNYDATAAAPLDVSTTLAVTCTNGSPYTVRLDAGTAAGATVTTRQMSSGVNRLNYALYRDAAHTQNWGVTDGSDTVGATGTGSSIVHTVYGRVAINQYLPAATYTDTITVTVNF